MAKAHDTQIDGGHYTSLKIQPFWLGYAIAEGDAGFVKLAKYLSRQKGDPKINLKKAAHVCMLRCEVRISPIEYSLNVRRHEILHDFADQLPNSEKVHQILLCYLDGDMAGAVKNIGELISELPKPKKFYFGREV